MVTCELFGPGAKEMATPLILGETKRVKQGRGLALPLSSQHAIAHVVTRNIEPVIDTQSNGLGQVCTGTEELTPKWKLGLICYHLSEITSAIFIAIQEPQELAVGGYKDTIIGVAKRIGTPQVASEVHTPIESAISCRIFKVRKCALLFRSGDRAFNQPALDIGLENPKPLESIPSERSRRVN